MKRIVIAAGGTGGHLIPAQQLADNLIKSGVCSEPFFLGGGLSENGNFRKKKYRYKNVSAAPLNKKKPFFLFSILKGILQSIRFFHKHKIDIVVGFGSYYVFPVLVAAILCRRKIVVFESNTVIGKVNYLFWRKAKIAATQFPIKDIGEKYKKKMIFVPMLPWIDEKKAGEGLKDKFTILIFGGSQGSDFINKTMCVFFLKHGKKISKDVEIIHICGSAEKVIELKDFYKSQAKIADVYVSAYEKDMAKIYASSDLVISRAGASSISELIFFSLPSFLIPYPFAAKNHQETNAFFMKEEVGGSEVFLEKDFSFDDFSKKLIDFIENKKKYLQLKDNLNLFREKIQAQKRKSLDDLIAEL